MAQVGRILAKSLRATRRVEREFSSSSSSSVWRCCFDCEDEEEDEDDVVAASPRRVRSWFNGGEADHLREIFHAKNSYFFTPIHITP